MSQNLKYACSNSNYNKNEIVSRVLAFSMWDYDIWWIQQQVLTATRENREAQLLSTIQFTLKSARWHH